MQSRTLLVFGLLLFAALVAALLDPTRVVLGKLAGEPFYAGRPISYWSRKLTGDPAERSLAIRQLSQPEAVPLLQAMLAPTSRPGEGVQRVLAVELLAGLGPDAYAAGVALLPLLKDRDPLIPPVVAAAIPKVGLPATQAVPALLDVLNGPAQVPAARAISTYKAAAVEALPALEQMALNPQRDTEARWNAIRTIGKIGPPAVIAVPTLLTVLDDPESTIREHAAEAIGDIGPDAAFAIPQLLPLLSDDDTRVRLFTCRALGDLGVAAQESAPAILPLLDDPQPNVRAMAIQTLQALAPELILRRAPPAPPLPEPMPQPMPSANLSTPADDSR